MKEIFLSQATLLYVEDDKVIRDILERRLAKHVKELYVAVDGQDGFEKFNQYKPDIILTDITMPRMNGIEMSKKIKEIDTQIPIVIMSAHSDTSYLLEAIKLGINGYLLKPVDKVKLFETLEVNVKVKALEKIVIEDKKQILHQSRFALLGEMISMIAHQWRQPLNVIAMTIMHLQTKFHVEKLDLNKNENLEVFDNSIQRIEDCTQSLSQIIDNFAHFYKPSSEIISTDINEFVGNSVKLFYDSLELKEIVLIEEYICTKNINIYQNEFMQICFHILNNSYENLIQKDIKNPQIKILTRDYEFGIELIISDNAKGISPEIIDKIFDPYFSTKEEKNGTGLGLYMSKLVIEEYLNGTISVENENEGAKFIIRLRGLNE